MEQVSATPTVVRRRSCTTTLKNKYDSMAASQLLSPIIMLHRIVIPEDSIRMMDDMILSGCDPCLMDDIEATVSRLIESWNNYADYYPHHIKDCDQVLDKLSRITSKVVFNGKFTKMVQLETKFNLKTSVQSCGFKLENASPSMSFCLAFADLVPEPWSTFVKLSPSHTKEDMDNLWNTEGWLLLEERLDVLLSSKLFDQATMILELLLMKGIQWHYENETTISNDVVCFNPFYFDLDKLKQYILLYVMLWSRNCANIKVIEHVSTTFVSDMVLKLLAESENPNEEHRLFPKLREWKKIKKITSQFVKTCVWVSLKRPNSDLKALRVLLQVWMNDLSDGRDLATNVNVTVDSILARINDVSSSAYIYVLGDTIKNDKMDLTDEIAKTKYVEIYIRAISLDIKLLEVHSAAAGVNKEHIKDCQKSLSRNYVHLADHFGNFPNTSFQCLLTAHSLYPQECLYSRLFPDSSSSENLVVDHWQTDSAEKLGLSSLLYEDLNAIINVPRFKAICSWASTEELKSFCKKLIDSGGELFTDTKLEYINTDFKKFKNLKSSTSYDDYIEKGYAPGDLPKNGQVSDVESEFQGDNVDVVVHERKRRGRPPSNPQTKRLKIDGLGQANNTGLVPYSDDSSSSLEDFNHFHNTLRTHRKSPTIIDPKQKQRLIEESLKRLTRFVEIEEIKYQNSLVEPVVIEIVNNMVNEVAGPISNNQVLDVKDPIKNFAKEAPDKQASTEEATDNQTLAKKVFVTRQNGFVHTKLPQGKLFKSPGEQLVEVPETSTLEAVEIDSVESLVEKITGLPMDKELTEPRDVDKQNSSKPQQQRPSHKPHDRVPALVKLSTLIPQKVCTKAPANPMEKFPDTLSTIELLEQPNKRSATSLAKELSNPGLAASPNNRVVKVSEAIGKCKRKQIENKYLQSQIQEFLGPSFKKPPDFNLSRSKVQYVNVLDVSQKQLTFNKTQTILNKSPNKMEVGKNQELVHFNNPNTAGSLNVSGTENDLNIIKIKEERSALGNEEDLDVNTSQVNCDTRKIIGLNVTTMKNNLNDITRSENEASRSPINSPELLKHVNAITSPENSLGVNKSQYNLLGGNFAENLDINKNLENIVGNKLAENLDLIEIVEPLDVSRCQENLDMFNYASENHLEVIPTQDKLDVGKSQASITANENLESLIETESQQVIIVNESHESLSHNENHESLSHNENHESLSHNENHENLSHTESHESLPHSESHDDLSHIESHEDLSHIESHEDLSHIESHEDLSHIESQENLSHIESHEDLSHNEGRENLIHNENQESLSHNENHENGNKYREILVACRNKEKKLHICKSLQKDFHTIADVNNRQENVSLSDSQEGKDISTTEVYLESGSIKENSIVNSSPSASDICKLSENSDSIKDQPNANVSKAHDNLDTSENIVEFHACRTKENVDYISKYQADPNISERQKENLNVSEQQENFEIEKKCIVSTPNTTVVPNTRLSSDKSNIMLNVNTKPQSKQNIPMKLKRVSKRTQNIMRLPGRTIECITLNSDSEEESQKLDLQCNRPTNTVADIIVAKTDLDNVSDVLDAGTELVSVSVVNKNDDSSHSAIISIARNVRSDGEIPRKNALEIENFVAKDMICTCTNNNITPSVPEESKSIPVGEHDVVNHIPAKTGENQEDDVIDEITKQMEEIFGTEEDSTKPPPNTNNKSNVLEPEPREEIFGIGEEEDSTEPPPNSNKSNVREPESRQSSIAIPEKIPRIILERLSVDFINAHLNPMKTASKGCAANLKQTMNNSFILSPKRTRMSLKRLHQESTRNIGEIPIFAVQKVVGTADTPTDEVVHLPKENESPINQFSDFKNKLSPAFKIPKKSSEDNSVPEKVKKVKTTKLKSPLNYFKTRNKSYKAVPHVMKTKYSPLGDTDDVTQRKEDSQEFSAPLTISVDEVPTEMLPQLNLPSPICSVNSFPPSLEAYDPTNPGYERTK